MTEKVLLSGDVDAIKDYVFETSYLPQIRGSSQLLIDCENDVESLVHVSGGDIIYCSGGSFLFLVPLEIAGNLKEDIEKIYLNKTGAATVTVSIEREWAPQVEPGTLDKWAMRIIQASSAENNPLAGFALRASLIAADLREAKNQRTIAPFREALPFAKRCDCCGKRMASKRIPRSPPGEIPEILRACSICDKKHHVGGSHNNEPRGKFNRDFSHFMLEKDPMFAALQAPDLENLTYGMNREHLALIYADGNEIGSLLRRSRSIEDYMAISESLSKGTRDALFEALFDVCGSALSRSGKTDNFWPFEIVNIGGDDVTVLIQAGYAWELAVEFLENFENKIMANMKNKIAVWPKDWSKVTASCGIAIADVKYPVRYLQKLADSSLKKAKRKAKEDPQNPESAIDFIWLPSPVLSESVESLDGYYNRDNRSLTARPYSLKEARELNNLSKRAIELPGSQRHLWGEALERGMSASRNAIFYNIARMKDEKRMEFKQFLADITSLIAPHGWKAIQSIWVERKEGDTSQHCTALLDVLELAELLSMRTDLARLEENA